MKTFFSALIFCASVSVVVSQDNNPLDPKQILQELQDIQTKQQILASSSQKRSIDLVFKASGNKDAAIAFYEEAQMVTQFQGANRENAQFRDWKKRQEDQLKNDDFCESVRLHLFYLGLTLKKAADTKPEELVPQVAEYLKVLDTSSGALEVKDSLLKNSVADGIFAKWLGLGPELGKAKDWEMNPEKADQIAAKFLLPIWRKQKSPALLAYWDGRIVKESAIVNTVKLDFQEKNFSTIRKPELLWLRSQEFIHLDQPNRAIQEMFGLIKNHPNHPNVMQWIEALQKMLQAPVKEVTP